MPLVKTYVCHDRVAGDAMKVIHHEVMPVPGHDLIYQVGIGAAVCLNALLAA